MGPSDDKSPLQTARELLGVISADLGTADSLKSLLGVGVLGLAAVAARQYHNVRPVVRLYDRLLEEAGPLTGARVKMSTDPYRALRQEKALIMQGRNKEGKTTLLCTALPWYHRRGPWAYYGLYFNGGHGNAVSNFKEWHTVQLFGNLNMGGSETQYALNTYKKKQHLRVWLHGWGLSIAPKPCYVIVDQYEELLKRFPEDALRWANSLTNTQVRECKARVIFVVNSHAGAQTLLNLNQGPRFTKLVLEPPSGEGADVDMEIFHKCGRNIGLYKLVLAEIERGAVEKGKEETFIRKQVARWEEDFHIPHPFKYDASWSDLAPRPEKSAAQMKQRLGKALEQALLAQKGKDGQPTFTPEEVEERMKIAMRCWKDLSKMQVLNAMEPEWAKRLVSVGADEPMAESLTVFFWTFASAPHGTGLMHVRIGGRQRRLDRFIAMQLLHFSLPAAPSPSPVRSGAQDVAASNKESLSAGPFNLDRNFCLQVRDIRKLAAKYSELRLHVSGGRCGPGEGTCPLLCLSTFYL